jgi:hypothetical protein
MGGWPRTTDGRLEQVNGCSRWRLMLGSYTNGTVTFRIRVPLAQAVAFHGEWMAQGAGEAMRRQADGAWSLTVGHAPDLYLYAFEIDGLRVPDPLNRFAKNGYPGLSSLLEVPGAGFLSIRGVPHGTVHIHTYASRTTSSLGRLHVCTRRPAATRPAADHIPFCFFSTDREERRRLGPRRTRRNHSGQPVGGKKNSADAHRDAGWTPVPIVRYSDLCS